MLICEGGGGAVVEGGGNKQPPPSRVEHEHTCSSSMVVANNHHPRKRAYVLIFDGGGLWMVVMVCCGSGCRPLWLPRCRLGVVVVAVEKKGDPFHSIVSKGNIRKRIRAHLCTCSWSPSISTS